jgi:hypothetical protein
MIPSLHSGTEIADEKVNGEEHKVEASARPSPIQIPDHGTQSHEDCEDECIAQCQGTFRWTRRSKVLLKTFRELLFQEVKMNLRIALHPCVINIIARYTFEPTHSFVPHMRIDSRPSLTRGEDIMDLLKCDPDFELNAFTDYTLRKLIGRTFYGFEIHDSPYARIEDPNPCELMTNEGGVFLVPKTLCYWFLNEDWDGSVPALCRFKHRIVDARVRFYVTGPYLQLSLTPIVGVTDTVKLRSTLTSPRLFEESDQESDTSLETADIEVNIVNYRRSSTNDSLAIEIANSWKDTRESVLVVVPQNPFEIPISSEDEISDSLEPVQQMRVLDKPSLTLEISDSLELVLGVSGSKKKVDLKNPRVDCLIVSDNSTDRRNVRSTETTKTSSTIGYQDTPCTLTSPGSIIGENGYRDELRLDAEVLILEEPVGEKKQTLDSNTGVRPSIFKTSEQKIYVLELGAGFVGSQDLSLSFQHNKATPNPHVRDLSLDSLLDLDIEE